MGYGHCSGVVCPDVAFSWELRILLTAPSKKEGTEYAIPLRADTRLSVAPLLRSLRAVTRSCAERLSDWPNAGTDGPHAVRDEQS